MDTNALVTDEDWLKARGEITIHLTLLNQIIRVGREKLATSTRAWQSSDARKRMKRNDI